jgi:outer membrane protein
MTHRKLPGLLALVAMAVGLSISTGYAADTKIGYVFMDDIRGRAEVYQEAGTRIQQIVTEQEQEASQKQAEIQRLQDQLQRQQSLMTEQTRAQREGQIRQKVGEYQQWAAGIEQELVRQQAELIRPIDARTIEMINTIAEAEGYDIVLDGAAIAYMRNKDEHNLTDRIVEALNQE